MAPKKLLDVLSKRLSSVRVPGEIILTTSLLSGPFFKLILAKKRLTSQKFYVIINYAPDARRLRIKKT